MTGTPPLPDMPPEWVSLATLPEWVARRYGVSANVIAPDLVEAVRNRHLRHRIGCEGDYSSLRRASLPPGLESETGRDTRRTFVANWESAEADWRYGTVGGWNINGVRERLPIEVWWQGLEFFVPIRMKRWRELSAASEMAMPLIEDEGAIPADETRPARRTFTLTHALAIRAYGEDVASRYARPGANYPGGTFEHEAKKSAALREGDLRYPTTSRLPGTAGLDDLASEERLRTELVRWEANDLALWNQAQASLLQDLIAGRWYALNQIGRVGVEFWQDTDLDDPRVRWWCYRPAPSDAATSAIPRDGPNSKAFAISDAERIAGDQMAQPLLTADYPPPAAPAIRKRPSNGPDFREYDVPLVADMHALLKNDQASSPENAARAVVKRARGGGSEASKVKRLALRYRQAHPNQS